jgi:hypothetical protein
MGRESKEWGWFGRGGNDIEEVGSRFCTNLTNDLNEGKVLL